MRGGAIRAAVISDTHGLLRPEVEKLIATCDVRTRCCTID